MLGNDGELQPPVNIVNWQYFLTYNMLKIDFMVHKPNISWGKSVICINYTTLDSIDIFLLN